VGPWLAGRSAAWVDDDVSDYDAEVLMRPGRSRFAAPHSERVLAVRVAPSIGLVWKDVETLREWAQGLS